MTYFLNLQLFAEADKTEKPTPRRRRKAREEGQVVQSKELTTVFILLAALLGTKILGEYIAEYLLDVVTNIYLSIVNVDILFNENNLMVYFIKGIKTFAIIAGPILGITFLAALLISLLQVGFLFTTKPLNIKLSRINPVEGFKRLFSKRALLELLKSILKVALIGYVAYSYVYDNIHKIINLVNLQPKSILINIFNISYDFAIRIIFAIMAIALIDYFFQWRQHEKSLMMTKQELKEEYKETEGDPLIKSKIKERQRKVAMSRMMQEVPKADVIITNPTHIAVAIRYDKDLYEAPYVVAKGKDLVAENIKRIAQENSVPIVENKPVARILYDTLEVGDLIPEDLYEAIAEILAYVYSLRYNY